MEVDLLDDQNADTNMLGSSSESCDSLTCRVYGKEDVNKTDPAMEFEVKLTDTEVEYSPVHIRQDVRAHLPDYMAVDIVFEIKEAPVFISRLLDQTNVQGASAEPVPADS